MKKIKYYSKSQYYKRQKHETDNLFDKLSPSDSDDSNAGTSSQILNEDTFEANPIENQNVELPQISNSGEIEEDNELENENPESTEDEFNISSSNDEEEMLRPQLQIDLANWLVNHNISQLAGDELLQILNKNNIRHLPKCAKTLLQTPKSQIQITAVPPEEYHHFGLEAHLLQCNYDFLEQDEVNIDIGIDGIPLFQRSSTLNLWPIFGAFVNKTDIKPFLIGAYVGYKHPSSSDIFLKQFLI